VRDTYSDQLGDLINLDFSPKTPPEPKPAAPPPAPPSPSPSPKSKVSASQLARAAAVKRK